jgi:DNA helicase-2/ATP-dependent DNA helicase PcrA
VFVKYNKELRRSNAMDFADLLGNTVQLLRMGENGPAGWLIKKFRQVLVDEFQDTNRLQMTMIDLISAKSELCVVGDDDQSIYGWRGADPGGMMRFSQRPGVRLVKLEANYRSTPQILDCANAVIAKNLDRLGKTLRSSRDLGAQVRVSRLLDEKEEAEHVASKISGPRFGDHAILYRTHAQSRPLEEALRRRGIPYTIVGGLRFYDRSEIKDLLSYYRLAVNPKSDVDLIRIINRPARGLGAKAVGALKTAASKANSSMHEAIARSSDPKLARMRMILDRLTESAIAPLRDFHEVVLKTTWYRDALADTAKLSGSGAQREMAAAKLENVDELASDVEAFSQEHPSATVAVYLEHVALVSSFDRETGPSVSMMTVHAAKGLEFPRVFMVGAEEGLLPHTNSLQTFEKTRDPGPIEEERRLAYVAITRAMDVLDITLTHRRTKGGQSEASTPSRFLRDLPRSRIALMGIDPAWWGQR